MGSSYRFFSTIILVALAFSDEVAAKKRTVGDLLKKIENEASTSKIKKGTAQLPQFGPVVKSIQSQDLRTVQPPRRSTLYYEEGTNEAELEKVTDEGISQLFKLTQQFKTSPRRGELWLRLAELYVEKARLIEYRIQTKYDEDLAAYREKKRKSKPRLNLTGAQAYNKKAIQLYEWFLRDYPKDEKVPQALFFLGYNYFELGQESKGKEFYARLTKEHPQSLFVDESHFALGEYFFDRSDFQSALQNYSKITRNPRARLYSFALYKAAWSQYKTGQVKAALSSLEKVIRAGRLAKGQDDQSSGGVSRIRLAGEATKDLVVFYGEAGSAENARSYFERVVGIKNAPRLMEALAYFYADTGNRTSASELFRDMIDREPRSPKAYDYQYQIVRLYGSSVEGSLFRKELFQWIEGFGPNSSWARANSSDQELLKKSTDLIETTLRNYILQQHQTAQNSRAEFSQKQAQSGYDLYFTVFAQGDRAQEMHFFYAELLFDMKEWEKSAYHYTLAAKDLKSAYHKKASLNAVLALEKRLPDANRLKQLVGDSQEPIRFPKEIGDFEKVALSYLEAYPQGESVIPVRYKLASLYYYFNQYDRALPTFQYLVDKHPETKEAQYSANLILDIYNIKKDFEGLEKAGKAILSKAELRSSPVGNQVSGILQRSSFKKAQELEAAKNFEAAAAAYEAFAVSNPSSELSQSAKFNAAVNYERANNIPKAIALYSQVAQSNDKKDQAIAKNSSKFIAVLLERTGQYRAAAEAFEEYVKKYPDAIEFYFNAAVIFDGLKEYPAALRNYQKYFDTNKKQERLLALFLIGRVWEKRGNARQARKYYEDYMNSNPIDPESVVEASFRIAKISEDLKQIKKSEEWFKKTIVIQKRLSAKKKLGVSFAAESQFRLLLKVYDEFRRIKIPANPQRQAAAVNQKLSVLERLKNELKKVIRYDDAQFIVAALALTGQSYQHMAASLYNAPLPKGLDPEGLETYKKGIEQVALPFKDQAIQSYKEAIEKGYRLEGYGDWLDIARKELSELDEKTYPHEVYASLSLRIPSIEVRDSRRLEKPLVSSQEVKDLFQLFKRKNSPDLLEKVVSALSKDPDHPQVLNLLALQFAREGQPDLAKIILNRALVGSPNNSGLVNNLGVLSLSEGQIQRAVSYFKEGVADGNDEANLNLAGLKVQFGDYAGALRAMEKGMGRSRENLEESDSMAIANNFGIALMATGNFKESERVLDRLVKEHSKNISALLNYSILLIEKLKAFDKGRSVLNKLKFTADQPQVLNRVADLEKQIERGLAK